MTYLTALVKMDNGVWIKYHNIPDTLIGKASFLAFVKKRLLTAEYVNLYDNITKQFVIRLYKN